MFSQKKAFTLVELLVVIAIIGLLATLSVIALSNARAKSRDTKRMSDIKQVQTALELYFNDQNRYPTVTEWNTGSIYSTSSEGTTTYMQVIPTAPTNSDGDYCSSDGSYHYASDGDSYVLSTCLGNNAGSLGTGIVIANSASVANCGDATAKDADGNIYNTVQIGTQCWLQQNLNVGTMLTNGTTMPADNSIIEKWCYNNYEINPSPATVICNNGQVCGGCDTNGGLYHWDEAMQYSETAGIQGICPIGWHIPTDAEQYTLENYLTDAGQTCDPNRYIVWDCATAGTKLKLGGSSGFEALLAGYRNTDGTFYDQGYNAYFWSSIISGSNAWARYLNSGLSTVLRRDSSQAYGFTVRCLKD